ncbi:MAG: hypothetical protein K0S75_332 [Clostridia bacterium]|jgi:hypothetical protein|nr:hypothetical protein [Clostridia bacterium]
MNKLTLKWEFNDITEDQVERYCHNCSKKVLFTDSMKRRKNANGKSLYEFAIYKCERDHTWNKLLKICSAHTDNNAFPEEEILEISQFEAAKEFLISETKATGIGEIEIYVKNIEGRQRIDKLLALYISDLSRTQIKVWIDSGKIQIDNCDVKPDTPIRNHQTIQIKL